MTEKPAEYDSLAVENVILTIRDQKVILNSDLAKLYRVETKRLSEQVRRNAERFPLDFMFGLRRLF